tara:strand:+ start:6551 stop:6697 length:147 start_codon:yes stop_codon:yes gene_type:complete
MLKVFWKKPQLGVSENFKKDRLSNSVVPLSVYIFGEVEHETTNKKTKR